MQQFFKCAALPPYLRHEPIMWNQVVEGSGVEGREWCIAVVEGREWCIAVVEESGVLQW